MPLFVDTALPDVEEVGSNVGSARSSALGSPKAQPPNMYRQISNTEGLLRGALDQEGVEEEFLGGKWAIQKRPSESTQNFCPHSFSPCPVSCSLLVCE